MSGSRLSGAALAAGLVAPSWLLLGAGPSAADSPVVVRAYEEGCGVALSTASPAPHVVSLVLSLTSPEQPLPLTSVEPAAVAAGPPVVVAALPVGGTLATSAYEVVLTVDGVQQAPVELLLPGCATVGSPIVAPSAPPSSSGSPAASGSPSASVSPGASGTSVPSGTPSPGATPSASGAATPGATAAATTSPTASPTGSPGLTTLGRPTATTSASPGTSATASPTGSATPASSPSPSVTQPPTSAGLPSAPAPAASGQPSAGTPGRIGSERGPAGAGSASTGVIALSGAVNALTPPVTANAPSTAPAPVVAPPAGGMVLAGTTADLAAALPELSRLLPGAPGGSVEAAVAAPAPAAAPATRSVTVPRDPLASTLPGALLVAGSLAGLLGLRLRRRS